MANDSRTFQEFLLEQRQTNEQLSSLKQENKLMSDILADIRRDAKQDSTMEAYIQSALPEIIADTANTREQLNLDKKLRQEEIKAGVFEVDNILGDHTQIFENIKKILSDSQVILQAIFALNTNQFDYEKLQDFREKRKELATDPPPPPPEPEPLEDEEGKTGLSALFGGLTGALGGASLGALALGLGKGLFKGGFYGGLGIILGDLLSKQIDDPFFKETLEKGLPAAAIGLGLGGVPGALAGLAVTGIGGVIDFISGQEKEISAYDFAAAGLGTTGALYFANSKVRALLKAGKGGVPVRLGAAILSTPVLIAGGIGIALGLGARVLANKIDEYQDLTLKKAEEITKKIDEDLGKSFAENETGLLERMGFTFGQPTSETGTFRQATVEGIEEFKQQGELSEENSKILSDVASSLLKLSEENIETILQDSRKTKNLLETIQNLFVLSTEDQISTNIEDLLLLESKVSDVAKSLDEQGLLPFVAKSYKVTESLLSNIQKIQDDIKNKEQEILNLEAAGEDSVYNYKGQMSKLKKELKDFEDDLQNLTIVPESMQLGVSLDEIIKDMPVGKIDTLLGQETLIIQRDIADSIIQSNDLTNKFLLDKMSDGYDMARDLEFALRNPSGGQVTMIGGNTAINSSANTISLSPAIQPNEHTFNVVSASGN